MKITIFSALLLIFSSSYAATKLVHISRSIEIKQDIDVVFEHVKNTMNDDTWRSEVNSMEADGDFEVGTTYTEDAHIGFKKHFITKTTLVELIENQKALYITPDNAKYYLSSLRSVTSNKDGMTVFTYTVEFDPAMSKETLGTHVPNGVLEFSYGIIMGQYLKNLKDYLEGF